MDANHWLPTDSEAPSASHPTTQTPIIATNARPRATSFHFDDRASAAASASRATCVAKSFGSPSCSAANARAMAKLRSGVLMVHSLHDVVVSPADLLALGTGGS